MKMHIYLPLSPSLSLSLSSPPPQQIYQQMKEKEINKHTLEAIGSSISFICLETEDIDINVTAQHNVDSNTIYGVVDLNTIYGIVDHNTIYGIVVHYVSILNMKPLSSN